MKPRLKKIILQLLVAADPSSLSQTVIIDQVQAAAQPAHPTPSDIQTCLWELNGRGLIVGTFNDVLEVTIYNVTATGKNFLSANP